MFVRAARILADLILCRDGPIDDIAKELEEYVARLHVALQEAYQQANHNAEEARRKHASTTNGQERLHSPKGDIVLVANKALRGRHKIANKIWEESPYRTVSAID